MYGIKRNDADASGKGAGWRVVLTRERVRYRAFFRAGGYPSMEHALAAAQAFRDALLKLLPPIKPYVMRAQKPRSGMQGVVRLAGKRPAWLAELRVDGRKRSKTFSVKKYGEDGARRRAQEARSAWEKASGFGQAVRLPAREVVKQLEDSLRARFGEVARARTARGRAFNDDAMYAIARHERDVASNGRRWSVTLSRRRVAYSKAFYDGVYGGIEPALIAARRFRDIGYSARPRKSGMRQPAQARRCDNCRH